MQLYHDGHCRSLRLSPLAATQRRVCCLIQACVVRPLTHADHPLVLLQGRASAHCSTGDAGAALHVLSAALPVKPRAKFPASAAGCPAAGRPPQPCAPTSLRRSRPAPRSQARCGPQRRCRPCQRCVRRLCLAECRPLHADLVTVQEVLYCSVWHRRVQSLHPCHR